MKERNYPKIPFDNEKPNYFQILEFRLAETQQKYTRKITVTKLDKQEMKIREHSITKQLNLKRDKKCKLRKKAKET